MPANVVVPEVGESIVDARIARWLKKEGDTVAVGEPLVELETDKIDVEVPAPKSGVIEKITQPDGADVKIGEVLGTIKEGPSTALGAGATAGNGSGAAAKAAPAPAASAAAGN